MGHPTRRSPLCAIALLTILLLLALAGCTEPEPGASEAVPRGQHSVATATGADTVPQARYGVGILYWDQDVYARPPVHDSIEIRAAPVARSDKVGRIILAMPTGAAWSYRVEATAGDVAGNLLEYGYEQAGVPFDSVSTDSAWARVLYARDPQTDELLTGWARLRAPGRAHLLWSEWLPRRAQFFLNDRYATFFDRPGGERVGFPLVPGHPRADYRLEPDSAAGEWLRVRVVSPSDACGSDPSTPVRDTTAWIRYLDEQRRPLVWYYTRGC